ncbi:MAG: M14 family zinc carboxypeptidase [Solirubrobacteraceae bacterium]
MSRFWTSIVLGLLGALVLTAPAAADGRNPINAYRVAATPQNLSKLALAGFDVTEGRRGSMIEIYGTAVQVRKLRDSSGINARRVDGAGSASEPALKALADPYTGSDAAYKVWRRFDRVPGDGKEQYLELYDRLLGRAIVQRYDLGDSYLGRDFIALKVTKDAKTAHPRRPAVLYNALQHSREWLAGETCRRSLLYFVNNYGVDARVTRLVDTRELWFYCVANPDGYEYTFTEGNRLWRKNMADNDGNGIRGENGDGVDPNRNFPEAWGLDNEGSSPEPASETYRGPEPYAPEPETRAMLDLFDRGDFVFQKNDHTAAELLLYPQGWQQYTPTADDPIFTALAGTDKDPAIKTFDPDLGAELYITNGETSDTAYNREGILSYTPEGTLAKDPSVSGFEYADSEGEIQAEFARHRDFVIDLAESAGDPAQPVSHLKNDVKDFYVDTFAESFGDPQKVQVLAKRSLGAIVMRYRVNGGATHEVSTSEVTGEERYNKEPGLYLHKLRGTVTGTSPGDSVEVWFAQAGGSKRSAAFTYSAAVESANRVLVLAAEDYTGPTPAQDPSGPQYADEYLAAVQANGVGVDLYDVDARGRRAPHPLGVLSHYDAVLWYTGDDYLTREPGQVPGTGTSRLALEEQLAVRDFINEGGKVLYAGKHAGQQYVEGFEFRNFGFPQPNEDKQGRWCDPDLDETRDGCIAHVDDFLQYYLGAYLRVDNGGSWLPDGTVYPITGVSPFDPLTWTFSPTAGDPGAGAPTATFGITSSMIDRPAYQDSRAVAGWDRPEAGPFSPHTGSQYMATGHDDEAYKRLHTTVDLSAASSAGLNFWTSFDLEAGWDHIFVEVRPVGTEEWTTLPDANGHTSQATGDSCFTDGGWWQLHARMLHYQTVSGDSCTPTGTTGQWHAATGSSNGWQEWQVDLPVGQPLEVAIVVATDWAVGNLGAWVDDATITVDGTTASSTSFEDDAGAWTIGPAPEGTPNPEQWTRTPQQFVEGAVVGTNDTVYAGFELGTLKTPAERASFMHEVLQHLGILPPD